jgi:hypothetical protein
MILRHGKAWLGVARQDKDFYLTRKRFNMNEEIKVHNMTNGLTTHTSLLIELLSKGNPGDVLTDTDMSLYCGRNTASGHSGYNNLGTAIKYVLNHHNMLWERIPKSGCIKCKNAYEAVDSARKDVKVIHRKTRKSIKKLGTVDLEKVDMKDRSSVLSMTAQLGAIAMFSHSDTQRKLSSRNIKSAPELNEVLGLCNK